MIELVLPSAYPSPQLNDKSIGSAIFAQVTEDSLSSGRLAPHGKYVWTCASFVPLESTTKMANLSAQPFLHSSRQKVPVLDNGQPYPLELPLPMWDHNPHLTHGALGPCEPTTQTAPRSVQPCLHRWPQSVPILYNGSPVSPSKLLLPMRVSGRHTWCLGPTRIHPSPHSNGISIASAVFAGLTSVTVTDRQTDRQPMLLGQ